MVSQSSLDVLLSCCNLKRGKMDKSSKIILSIIAIALLGINVQLYKSDNLNLISKAHAVDSHDHDYYDIFNFTGSVERIIEGCEVYESEIDC